MVAQQRRFSCRNRRNQKRRRRQRAGKSPRQKAACQNAGAQVTSNTAPGYDGYMGTYVDPDNGDIINLGHCASQTQPEPGLPGYPIIIEPDVSGWGNNWNNGWNNSGWAGDTHMGPGRRVPGYPYHPLSPDFSQYRPGSRLSLSAIAPLATGLRRPP